VLRIGKNVLCVLLPPGRASGQRTPWRPAGSSAATRLQALTAGRSIVCQEKDRDRYGRIAAICRASGEDLGAILVRQGFAWAFTRFSVDCVDQQEEARAANRGHPLNAEDPVLVLIDMIHAVEPAARVVERLIMEAETALTWRSPALLAVNERA
jgi:hypothetical protein